jgi:hypothetical protein
MISATPCDRPRCNPRLARRLHPGTGTPECAVYCACGRATKWRPTPGEALAAWATLPTIAAAATPGAGHGLAGIAPAQQADGQ